MEAVMTKRKAPPMHCTSHSRYAIVVRYVGLQVLHITRLVRRGTERPSCTRLAPLQVRSASIQQFMYTYHTVSQNQEDKEEKNVLCRCRTKAMHVRSSVSCTIISSLGVCVSHNTVGYEQSAHSFSSAHTHQQT